MRAKYVELQIVSRSDEQRIGSDFRVGRILLAKHFRASQIASIDVDPRFARQLLLREESDFASGRVPLFVCECCADLECGALTVAVERRDQAILWRDFGYEGHDGRTPTASDEITRTGPFVFDRVQYDSVLTTYAKTRKSCSGTGQR
jgi:hypothetical protein